MRIYQGKAADRAGSSLVDERVPTKLKLSAAWGALMFLYIYADYIGLFREGMIEDLMAGEVWVFTITQEFLMGVSVMMSIPALMVLLSAVLRPNWNRRLNIGVGVVFGVIALAALVDESYAFYYYFTTVEVFVLGAIVRMAWNWPRLRAPSEGQPGLDQPEGSVLGVS